MNEEEQLNKTKKLFTPFTVINIILFFSAVISSLYFFYFKKNFDFVIEEPCSPLLEECFVRDCSNEDNCPPNGLSEFKRYVISAKDFKYCENEDCSKACMNEQIMCQIVPCEANEEIGESCLNLSRKEI